MAHPIINIDDLEFMEIAHGDRFGARMGAIGGRIGARKLGYNLTVVPPGKRAFPRHNHHVNEEMFFVIAGAGELIVGDAAHTLRQGDVVACPPGDQATAHQIVNTSDEEELRYLAVSTCEYPEIVDYPDSGKFGVREVTGRDADGMPTGFLYVGRVEDNRDYWEGE